MGESVSPLRYPGGKQILAKVLGHLIKSNGLEAGVYVEAFAGGAGAALDLLYSEFVSQIRINDADTRIFNFWESITKNTRKFLQLLHAVPLSVDEWERQREIYLAPKRHSRLKVGFATFYLNRCNRSGIIANAGLIGGRSQTGKWKIDARFNRTDLAKRIERVSRYRERILVSNLDAIEFLQGITENPSLVDRAFVYLDPPYYNKGSQLYMNHYTPEDHASFANFISKSSLKWVMSYDNVREIRKLYSQHQRVPFRIGYSARNAKVGQELLVLSESIRFPQAWSKTIPDKFITTSARITSEMPRCVT